MLSLRVFTAIASQKLGVLLIPVFSPLWIGPLLNMNIVTKKQIPLSFLGFKAINWKWCLHRHETLLAVWSAFRKKKIIKDWRAWLIQGNTQWRFFYIFCPVWCHLSFDRNIYAEKIRIGYVDFFNIVLCHS